MKNFTTLMIAGLLFLGFVACEKVGKNDESGKGGDSTKTGETAEGHDHEGSDDAAADMPLTTVQWEETIHDFGKIGATDSVAHTYKFKNTGNSPLKVVEVKPACGCTKGNFTQDAVAPGGEGFVELKFSPQGKTGMQSKTATVIMNTDPKMHQLSFKADIK